MYKRKKKMPLPEEGLWESFTNKISDVASQLGEAVKNVKKSVTGDPEPTDSNSPSPSAGGSKRRRRLLKKSAKKKAKKNKKKGKSKKKSRRM